MYIAVVVNRSARKNREISDDRSAELRRILGPWGEVHETRSVQQLGDVLQRLDRRITHLVSDGGDGSLHWLINEMGSRVTDSAQWPAFVPTNGGTIDFVARKAGVRGRVDTILRALRMAAEADRPPRVVWLDSVELRGVTVDGETFHRIGFALAAGGVGNRFFELYDRDRDPGRAAIIRVIASVVSDYALAKALPGEANRNGPAARLFSPTQARVVIDGAEVPSRVHTALHCGAFDVNLGGVLRLFPKAHVPGVLHFQAGELTPTQVIAALPALVLGRTIRGGRLWDVNGREMIIEAEHEPLSPIVDGERFAGIARLEVRAGPRVRIARSGR